MQRHIHWKLPSDRLNEWIRVACIDTSCDSGTSTLETYYSNFIARQLYAQKCLKYRKSQYWHPDFRIVSLVSNPTRSCWWMDPRLYFCTQSVIDQILLMNILFPHLVHELVILNCSDAKKIIQRPIKNNCCRFAVKAWPLGLRSVTVVNNIKGSIQRPKLTEPVCLTGFTYES